jgi:hypothetical protein
MSINPISGSDQNAQLWQLMLSAMDSSRTGISDYDSSSPNRPEGIGQFLGRMEQLRSFGSTQLQSVLSEIAGQLQGASNASEGAAQEMLGLMAGNFQSVSDSSDLAAFLSGSTSAQDTLESFFSADGRDPLLAALTTGMKSSGTGSVFQQLLAWQEAKGSADDIIKSVLLAKGV